uniref:hypothetical protein n=1 Tax=Rhizobium rhizogenes TaxID=359 RepID=UPI001F1A63A9|nr:hypothetical protein [Rhizobium rhizogenes]
MAFGPDFASRWRASSVVKPAEVDFSAAAEPAALVLAAGDVVCVLLAMVPDPGLDFEAVCGAPLAFMADGPFRGGPQRQKI